MSIPRWYLWEGGFLLTARAQGVVPSHAHHAIQIVLALDGCLAICGNDDGWRESRGIVVRADAEHSFDCNGALGVMVFVDPESSEGAWLSAFLRQDITIVPDTRLDSIVPELRAFAAGGPYRLLGHSFGGWIAFELACLLQQAGEPVAPLVLVDCDPPEPAGPWDRLDVLALFIELLEMDHGRSLSLTREALGRLDAPEQDKALLGRMIDAGVLPSRTPLKKLQALLRVFTANVKAGYEPATPYHGPVLLLNASEWSPSSSAHKPVLSPAEKADRWRRHATRLEAHTLDGNHMSVLKPPHVNQLAARMAKAWALRATTYKDAIEHEVRTH